MKIVDINYIRPDTLHQATQALRSDPGSVILGGGQTLMPLLAMRMSQPTALVDISRIKSFDFINLSSDFLSIGATVTQSKVLHTPAVQEAFPLLCHALSFVGHIQTRNRGTICGSLAFADPAAEMVLMAKLLGASIVLNNGTSERLLSADAFYSSSMGTTIEEGEILTEVRFPRLLNIDSQLRWGWAFEEVSARRSDFAWISVASLVGVDAQGICRAIRLGVGGINPTPYIHIDPTNLVGSNLTATLVDNEWISLSSRLTPTDSFHAPASYKHIVAEGLTKRVISAAYERAKDNV